MKNPLALHYFRSGYRRIKRLIAWFPIIWKDEDWQHEYLFKIMQFKISRLRKSINENKIVDLSCDYCKKMRTIWYKIEDAKEKADFDFLFEHLRKNVQHWWD